MERFNIYKAIKKKVKRFLGLFRRILLRKTEMSVPGAPDGLVTA